MTTTIDAAQQAAWDAIEAVWKLLDTAGHDESCARRCFTTDDYDHERHDHACAVCGQDLDDHEGGIIVSTPADEITVELRPA